MFIFPKFLKLNKSIICKPKLENTIQNQMLQEEIFQFT